MDFLKKVLKIAGLILLLSLAIIGVGITGVATIFPSNREKARREITTERIDDEEEDEHSTTRKPG